MSSSPDVVRERSLAAYTEKLWGTRVKLVPQSVIAVGVGATKLCNNNPRRFSLTLVNQGQGNVYIDWGQAPALSQGVLLAPNGGSVTLTALEDGEQVGYDVYAIAAAVGNNVSVWETQAE